MRDGTDALFVRAEEDGITGYGETTLPPYLSETISDSITLLGSMELKGFSAAELLACLENSPDLLGQNPGCRAGLHVALLDLFGRRNGRSVRDMLGVEDSNSPITLMTIGICETPEVAAALAELPGSGALKVKVGDAEATSRIRMIKQLDNRKLFLDGNQGLGGIQAALDLITVVGSDRILGFEQPFEPGQGAEHAELAQRSGVVVFGDESIRFPADMDGSAGDFNGVNIKLMKCGGLDRAQAMLRAGRERGMHIMLGSMSESSLGCTAMAQLASAADIVDLDGPWLISNDPWIGIEMAAGQLKCPSTPGLGVAPRYDLEFISIGS
ncbi:MAG: hypothetical protein IPL52_11215 [Flavobacteriales bacterium]|nr:hypothetical protein [Flavobacteriales bacterium]